MIKCETSRALQYRNIKTWDIEFFFNLSGFSLDCSLPWKKKVKKKGNENSFFWDHVRETVSPCIRISLDPKPKWCRAHRQYWPNFSERIQRTALIGRKEVSFMSIFIHRLVPSKCFEHAWLAVVSQHILLRKVTKRFTENVLAAMTMVWLIICSSRCNLLLRLSLITYS